MAGALEPLLAPDPLHPLVVDAPALDSQAPVNQSPDPAQVPPGQLPNPRVLLLELVKPFGLRGLWHPADFVYMPP